MEHGHGRVGCGFALLLGAALFLLFPLPAAAHQTRLYSGTSFGPDGVGGTESFVGPESIAVDPASADVLVYDIGAGKVYKFDQDGHPADFAGLAGSAIEGVGGEGSGSENQIAIAPPGAPGGTEGDIYVANNSYTGLMVYGPDGLALGELETGEETCGVATDPAGHLFVGVYPSVFEYVPGANPPTGPPTRTSTISENTCNVAADGLGGVYEVAFSGGVYKLEGVGADSAAKIDPLGSTIAIDPAEDDVLVNRGDEIFAYVPSGGRDYEFGSGDLSGSFGIAVDPSGDRVYVGDGVTKTVKVFGPAQTIPASEAATAIRSTSARLNGTLEPEGRQYTGCRFEYGLVATAGFESEGECEPDAAQIPADSSPHSVGLSLAGLQPDADYKFRLSAANALGTLHGDTLYFSTVGPPRLTEVVARDADQDAITLEATVDPRGADTSYRIEWGRTKAYGNVATRGSIGDDRGPTTVGAQVGGLAAATAYHYRLVAASGEGGETVGPDEVFETLGPCGMTHGRCFELVSRPDHGALAKPGKTMTGAAQPQFQAALEGSALAYTVELGYADATSGDEAVYLARRGDDAWASEQVTPPTLVAPQRVGGPKNSAVKVLSADLDCAVVSSAAPLLDDAPATVVEVGGTNLYRRDDMTGSYELITNLPPVGPPTEGEVDLRGGILGHEEYQVIGMSPDCRRIVFRTMYRYPGVNSSGGAHELYEWSRGTLRNVALIPGAGGMADPTAAESVPGALPQLPDSAQPPIGTKDATDYWRAVSLDGSHTVFTAISRFGGDIGRPAIFLRNADLPSVVAGTAPATDISQSETTTANDGDSRYWTASADGTRVFFTARYGLAANGSSTGAVSCFNAPGGSLAEASGAGCDLYEYDAGAPVGNRLTDLSPDTTDPKGAGVVGVLDASADGRYVYFAARGQFDGVGRTEAENLASDSYNVYLVHEGSTHFVAVISRQATEAGVLGSGALIGSIAGEWTSRATPDGSKLLFESSLDVPGGVSMVYLYSAADGTTSCLSCRRDGEPPFAAKKLTPLVDASRTNPEDRTVQPTILTDDGRRAYFYSFDRLATGAVEGRRNLYQWERGQVTLIATEPAGVPNDGAIGNYSPHASFFGGASADGGDVYFATPLALVGADHGDGWDVYDARVDGGLPEPGSPPGPCDAVAEGACNSAAGSSGDRAESATSTFAGPGNARPPLPKCVKGRVRRHAKCTRKARHKKAGHRRGTGHRKAGK